MKRAMALAGMTQWIECQPVNQRGARSIPSQGTYLGCGPGSQLGACKRQPINLSLAHHVFLPLSLPPLTYF